MNRIRLGRTFCVPFIGLLAIVLLGACGEASNDSAASTTSAGGADQYTAAGNALCDRTSEEVQAAFPDFEGEPTILQVQQLARDLGPVLVKWRAGVADLDPPATKEAQHQSLLDTLDVSIAKLEAAASTTEGAQVLLDAGGPPLDEPGNAANALFDRCPTGD